MVKTPPLTREMNMERARERSFFLDFSVSWELEMIFFSSVQPSWFVLLRMFSRVLCWSLKLDFSGSGGDVWSLVKVSSDHST